MPRPRALTVCTIPGCPTLTDTGRCTAHRREADRARGTAAERGYSGNEWTRARAAVLTRDPQCVLHCGRPSTVADHWPTSRRELIAQGVTDPDAPHRLRGICQPCHSTETAHHQPGGFNQR
jgi:5-methylcytosine-specific restriction protein A